MILGTGSLTWSDEADCAACAGRIAACDALRDAFVSLEGPLGAGKTTFVRHLLRALGVGGRIKSPTYTVMEPYQAGGLTISHFDFYRFSDPREWEDAGFREVFGQPGLKIAEWPDKVGDVLPEPDMRLRIEPSDDGSGERRQVTLEASSPAGLALLQAACAGRSR